MSTGVQLGLKLKQAGMSLAAAKRSADLEEARTFLVQVAMKRPDREVSADWVTGWKLGNAAGSLFKSEEWVFTGRWRPSTAPTRHSAYVRIWRLK